MELEAALRSARRADRYCSLKQNDQEALPLASRGRFRNEQTRAGFPPDVRALGPEDSSFPAGYRRMKRPPEAIFVRGSSPLPGLACCVALIGSRRATSQGLFMAEQLGAALARRGLCVVSGLALGIDAAAHKGALAAGGKTLAVLASPVHEPTPRRNAGLAQAILDSGGWLLSERPPEAILRPEEFPKRNRLVAGLVRLVVVVEAGHRSGTLSTVEHAQEFGVHVAAMPGPAGSPACAGSNALLRDGASWVESAEDVLDLLAWEAPPGQSALLLPPDEQLLLDSSGELAATASSWLRSSGLPDARARNALTALVGKGLLLRLPGGLLGRSFRAGPARRRGGLGFEEVT